MTKQVIKPGRPRIIPVYFNCLSDKYAASHSSLSEETGEDSLEYLFLFANKDEREVYMMRQKLKENMGNIGIFFERIGKVEDIYYDLSGITIYLQSYNSKITKSKMCEIFGAAKIAKELEVKKVDGFDGTVRAAEGLLRRMHCAHCT